MERKNKWDRPVKMPVSVHKTQVSSTERSEFREDKKSADPNKYCPLHKKPHPLRKCRGFREKSLEERKQLLKEHSLCFRCCSSTDHLTRNCSAEVKCMECGSTGHVTALHPGPPLWKPKPSPPSSEHGGEEDKADIQEVTSRCTQVCGEGVSSRACSKICLVSVYPAGHRGEAKKMYAMLDEQSNRSLARSKFFDFFKISGSSYPYTLKTCAGQIETTGRRACGFTVESADKGVSFPLPTLLECNQIPNNLSEIPTPTAACHHTHLKHIADVIPPLDPDTDILLLLGRDILRVHKVCEQISGPGNAPFAQRLDLGWVVVGDVCLGGAHRPLEVSSYKTSILENGRASHLQPCNSQIKVKEIFSQAPKHSHHAALTPTYCSTTHGGDSLGQTIFTRTADDHKLAPSVEDMMFLQIMEAEFHQDSSNSWVGPLPFRAAKEAEADYGSDARNLVDREFYVDDALKSFDTEKKAISVLGRAQKMLAASNLRLHKIASNAPRVIEGFPPEDRSKDVEGLDLFADELPTQRSLGLSWNMRTDAFMFQIADDQKP
ncbi:uncharacterized protein LOC117767006 [Hippoglossus hippoglossus]|uniref:uncharacterized protein LOC117767006 n=1 Tax=Hippoglossus hippoglossus TaxID=8267 RepID=UPI00148B47AB|nr:uncharacterized protein LOC117767006 [Hippoglossus hippoglossus]